MSRQPLARLRVRRGRSAHCYDARTGLWGHEGDPRAQGRFVDRCAPAARRNGLSERQLLYSTHEILSGRP